MTVMHAYTHVVHCLSHDAMSQDIEYNALSCAAGHPQLVSANPKLSSVSPPPASLAATGLLSVTDCVSLIGSFVSHVRCKYCHLVFVFLFLTSLRVNLSLRPCCCRWHYLVLLWLSGIVVYIHCILFIHSCWWAFRLLPCRDCCK